MVPWLPVPTSVRSVASGRAKRWLIACLESLQNVTALMNALFEAKVH
jgi:hypothetical protein